MGIEVPRPDEPVEQDEKAEARDIESLMLEWTTLGKEELSSDGPKRGFPVRY